MKSSELPPAENQWDALAAREEGRPMWDKTYDPAMAARLAALYRRTAHTIRHFNATGEHLCVCCLKPTGFHK